MTGPRHRLTRTPPSSRWATETRSPQDPVVIAQALSKLPERPSRLILDGLEQLKSNEIREVRNAAQAAIKKHAPIR